MREFLVLLHHGFGLTTGKTSQLLTFGIFQESLIPQLIVVPLSSREVDGVRKEKEKLTAASSPSRLTGDTEEAQRLKRQAIICWRVFNRESSSEN